VLCYRGTKTSWIYGSSFSFSLENRCQLFLKLKQFVHLLRIYARQSVIMFGKHLVSSFRV
jgi:hypothetical protein